MRTILMGLLAVAGIAIATPVIPPAAAQVTVETPAGGVRVGHDRDRDYYEHRRATTTITGIATMDAALSPSAATTDLSVEFGAATKYHQRTTARARPPDSTKVFGCGVTTFQMPIITCSKQYARQQTGA